MSPLQAGAKNGIPLLLVSKGWKLLRFAGTEMFHDPGKCVEEALRVAWEGEKTASRFNSGRILGGMDDER